MVPYFFTIRDSSFEWGEVGPLARNPSLAREALIGSWSASERISKDVNNKGLFVVFPVVISRQQNFPRTLSLDHATETKKNADRRVKESGGSIATFHFWGRRKFRPRLRWYRWLNRIDRWRRTRRIA